jgi:hypothetical protein
MFKKVAALTIALGVGWLVYSGHMGDFTKGFSGALTQSVDQAADQIPAE